MCLCVIFWRQFVNTLKNLFFSRPTGIFLGDMRRRVKKVQLKDDEIVFLCNLIRLRQKLFTVSNCFTFGGWSDLTIRRKRRGAKRLLRDIRARSVDHYEQFDFVLYDSSEFDNIKERLRLPRTWEGDIPIDNDYDPGEPFPSDVDSSDDEESEESIDCNDECTFVMQPPIRKTVSVRMALASWAVTCRIRTKHVSSLLKTLKSTGHALFKGLPKDARTLLADTSNMKERVKIVPVYEKKPVLASQKRRKKNSDGNLVSPRGVLVGHYVHLNLMDGILGYSPGNIEYFAQLKEWRKAYVKCPQFFQTDLYHATESEAVIDDDWNDVVSEMRSTLAHHKAVDETDDRQIIVEVSINHDGVSIRDFCAQYPQMTPVLACVTGLRMDGERPFRFSYAMPPFIVGYFVGSKKPDPDQVLIHVVKELIRLHPDNNKEGSVAVVMDAGIADAPALAEMKGTTSATGYYGLPRCTQKGIHQASAKGVLPPPVAHAHGPAQKTVTKKKVFVRYPTHSCRQRYHHDWYRYSIGKWRHVRQKNGTIKRVREKVSISNECCNEQWFSFALCSWLKDGS